MAKIATPPILAWHWLGEDRRLAHGKKRLVEPGATFRVKPPLELCSRGLHASIRPIDSLQYAPGPIVCRVELSGTIHHGDDKLCASVRKVLWMADASTALHLFACDVAEAALALVKEPDPRSLRAIEVKRLWVAGKATDDELAAAWAAAWAAAREAARAAAWAAAREAAWAAAREAAWEAAWAAAWAAARAAAWEAAWEAARAAAREAAWEAAREAARAAARAAAWEVQNGILERTLLALEN